MSLLRLAARRVAARTQLRCLSGSHSDFETVRKKVPATAEGVQAMIKEQARRGVVTRGLRMCRAGDATGR